MNYIWSAMILISLVTAAFTGKIPETVNAVFEGAATSVSTLIALAGAMCFWTGIMKIAENSGIFSFMSRLLSAPIKLLFPHAGKKAREYIAMNMTANLLGMGNAATPMGINAARELDSENDDPGKPSDNLCMLIAVNTAAFQLVPTTIIALRAGAGSHDPTSVIVPIWAASSAAFAVGVAAVKLRSKIRRMR